MTHLFVVVLSTSTDDEFTMEDKIPLDLDKESFTWKNPFKINGISTDCLVHFDFYIETEHGARVKVSRIVVPTGRLSYMVQKKSISHKKRRNSILRATKKPSEIESNNITVDNVILNYTAKKYKKQFIMFNVQSICMSSAKELLQNIVNQTSTRITMSINDVKAYKANHVFTLENENRRHKWFFKYSAVILQADVPSYDCDKDNSKENNCSFLEKIVLEPLEDITLLFTRDVFFPVGATGLSPKFIPVTIKRIDLDALVHRNAAITPGKEQMCLDRAIKYNILLQVKFTVSHKEIEVIPTPRTMLLSPRLRKSPKKKVILEAKDNIYTIDSIELIIDNYKETIEREFK